jgi:hypothetical protein
MHAIDSGKEEVKGMKPVMGRFADSRLISGDTAVFRISHSAKTCFLTIMNRMISLVWYPLKGLRYMNGYC